MSDKDHVTSNRMIEAFREDVRRSDAGRYDDRVVLTCFQAKKILAEIDALITPVETSGELERLSLEFSLASQQAAQLRDDRDHLRIRHQEAFRIINAATYYVSQSRQLHGEMVAWLNGASAQETSPEESNGIETDEECKCGSPLERHWHCRFCGVVPGPSSSVEPRETAADEGFQARVYDWMAQCFVRPDAMLPAQRSFRFIEEALELVQASGTSREDVVRLVAYVYGRPAGTIDQEIGGVMVTLSGLATSFGLSMEYSGNAELARCTENTEKIRAKDLAKPQRSPPPGSPEEPSRNQTTNSSGESSLTATASGDTGGAGLLPAASSPDQLCKRCRHSYTQHTKGAVPDDYCRHCVCPAFVPYSPEKAKAPIWDCACNDPTCAYCGPRLAPQHRGEQKP